MDGRTRGWMGGWEDERMRGFFYSFKRCYFISTLLDHQVHMDTLFSYFHPVLLPVI
jgi:hypothetical protein